MPADTPDVREATTDCRTPDGVTVGLVDALITTCRVLGQRDLSAGPVLAALADLAGDEDLAAVLRAAGWQLAPPGSVVVRLPEPEPFDREFCTAAQFSNGIEASVRRDGDVFISSWMEAYRSAEHARRHAAALLAAAAWVEATPAPGGAG